MKKNDILRLIIFFNIVIGFVLFYREQSPPSDTESPPLPPPEKSDSNQLNEHFPTQNVTYSEIASTPWPASKLKTLMGYDKDSCACWLVLSGNPAVKDARIEDIFDGFKAAPELAEKITIIFSLTTSRDFSRALDFSIFPNIVYIDGQDAGLKIPPIINKCQKLISIDLSRNRLTELPDLNGLTDIRLNAANNPLSENAQNLALKLSSTKRNSIFIKYKAATELSSNLAPSTLAAMTITDLIENFSALTDNIIKNEQDISNLQAILKEFYQRMLQVKYCVKEDSISGIHEAVGEQIMQCSQKAKSDSLFNSKIIMMLKYHMDKYGIDDTCKEFLLSTQENNFNSDSPQWLPNFNFLSGMDDTQSPIGKARQDGYTAPFTKGMLIPMEFSYWERDTFIKYYSAAEKKQLKLRFTNEKFVLKRNIDHETHIPKGRYIYAFSLNGGLYVEQRNHINHSSFRAGQYVICAGLIKVNAEGKIIHINNSSGHYKPSDNHLVAMAVWLYRHNYIDENCVISLGPRGDKTVKEIIEQKGEYLKSAKALEFVNDVLAGKRDKVKKPSF